MAKKERQKDKNKETNQSVPYLIVRICMNVYFILDAVFCKKWGCF